MLNRSIFFNKILPLFHGRITASQKQGLNTIIDVWEQSFYKQTPIPQFAYELGTTHHETGMTMQPVKEKGGDAYYKRMYDIKGSRPSIARTLGNLNPGDGAKFPGMGYVQNTGRSNARKATKRLRELGIIDNTIDFEKNPELQMVPKYAAAIMFIGMEEGWFTGRKLDQIIDANIDNDEHSDFLRARSIINGKDKAEAIADYADAYLNALALASVGDKFEDTVTEVLANKNIEPALSSDDDWEAPNAKPKKGQYAEEALTKAQIIYIQTRLRNLGYLMVGKVDGIWKKGGSVTAAICALQERCDLEVDGHYGPEVRRVLALDDGSNTYKVSEARKNTTVKDLRIAGSRIIKDTDAVKSSNIIMGSGVGLLSAGSAVVQYAPDALTWISPIKDFFGDLPPWIYGLGIIAFCVIMYLKSDKVQQSRLNDEQTGAHVGLPTPSSEDEDPEDVAVISNKSTNLPAFLQKESGPEKDIGVTS
jgi:putative chitinase